VTRKDAPEFVLSLNLTEAQLIMSLVQNPYTVEDPDDEPPHERAARESIWKALEGGGLLLVGALP